MLPPKNIITINHLTMIQFLRLLSLTATLLLAACAVTPLQTPPATHPASPQAAEAPARPSTGQLALDEPTQTTKTLLSDSTKPEPAQPQDSGMSDMGNMPGMKH